MIKQVLVLCLGNSFELLNTDNITAINVHGVDQFISSIHFSHSLKNVLGKHSKKKIAEKETLVHMGGRGVK